MKSNKYVTYVKKKKFCLDENDESEDDENL